MDWPWHEVLITLLVLAVPICVVNVILIILVYHRGSLDKLQNALLLSLGCSDFCAGFFAIPCILLCNLVTSSQTTCELCIASYLLNRFIMILSFLHLMAVIYERYLKIVHPFWFQSRQYTLLQSSRIVFVLWFTSLFIAASPLTFWSLENPCYDDETLARNLQYFDYACLAFFILLLLFMIYAFVRMFLVVRTHLLDINTTAVRLRASMDNVPFHSTAGSSNHLGLESEQNDFHHNFHSLPRRTRSTRSESELSRISTHSLRRQLLMKEVKIVLRFAAMVLMFILVWGAYFFLSMLQKETEDVPLIAQEVVFVVRFMNPLFDPLILTVNNKDFRPSYDLLRRCMDVRKIGRFLCSCGLPCWSRCLCARKQQSNVPEVNQTVQVRVENQSGGEYITNV